MINQNEMRKEEAVNRANIYGLLGSLYEKELSIESIELLNTTNIWELFNNGSIPEIEDIESLKEEYAYLFIGPGKHISLCESVWRDSKHHLYGNSTTAVIEMMESTGLSLDSTWTGLPDHISVEFDFMRKLCLYESESYNNDNTSEAQRSIDIQERFIREHLASWIPSFCERVVEQSESGFYQDLANITGEFLSEEMTFIDIMAVSS